MRELTTEELEQYNRLGPNVVTLRYSGAIAATFANADLEQLLLLWLHGTDTGSGELWEITPEAADELADALHHFAADARSRRLGIGGV